MSKENLTDLIAGQNSFIEESDIDIDSDDLSIQKILKFLEAQRYSGDTKDRKWLAKWTAITVSIWLLLVIVILFLNSCCLKLDSTVLITLLGTTTLNVLGLPFIVLRGHFPTQKN